MPEVNKQNGVSVHAGFPNPAADSRITGLDLNRLLISHSTSTFYFRIRGTEWEQAGIFDGDIAIVDRALDPRKTDTVIWWKSGDNNEFNISAYNKLPGGAVLWGVITAIIHELRKVT